MNIVYKITVYSCPYLQVWTNYYHIYGVVEPSDLLSKAWPSVMLNTTITFKVLYNVDASG